MSQWFKRQRQQYIMQTLVLLGRVNRADLMRHFDISAAIASTDIRAFLAEHPTTMAYDKTAKAYIWTRK